jgi:L-asparaginase/Glu-tRNA(Gln) amidotransferase subunit D
MRQGLILGHGLPGQKARIKLMVALGENPDRQAVSAAFQEPEQ